MKKPVHTDGAPKAIGPYSQAILVDDTLYLSEQIPIDPTEGKIVVEDIDRQTHQVMKNLQAILEAEDMTFDHVVKTTIYLTSLGDFQRVNEIYGGYFQTGEGQIPPARTTIQAAALPLGAKIGIDAVARR